MSIPMDLKRKSEMGVKNDFRRLKEPCGSFVGALKIFFYKLDKCGFDVHSNLACADCEQYSMEKSLFAFKDQIFIIEINNRTCPIV